MAREQYYQQFLRPHKMRWFAGVKVGDGEDVWCLSIQRTIEQDRSIKARSIGSRRFPLAWWRRSARPSFRLRAD